ncbi:MAG: hypothetical protein KAT62_06030 [Desulfuromonadales bacterium]|nr:hypothetical protein [Desulfuromonadales bacterium]
MRGSLFAIFLLTLLIAVVMTAIGLLINWGIIQSSLVEAGKPLPLLDKLVTGVILAVVGLLIELGRRWFIVKNIKDELSDTCLRLVGAAVVLPTTKQEECATNYGYVTGYLSEGVSLSSEEITTTLASNVDSAVKDMMNIRYGGASDLRQVPEVLPK